MAAETPTYRPSPVVAGRRPGLLSRAAAVPVPVALASIVVVSAAVHWVLALRHALPDFMPDEYIYTSLSRSLAAGQLPSIRGTHVAFPALLEPALTAPLWGLLSIPHAYGAVKLLNALVMASAALPAWAIARRIGLRRGAGLVCALAAGAGPNLYFVPFVMANAYSYPLALAALAAGLAVLEQPTARGQLRFLLASAAATFASIQFAVLPAALLLAVALAYRLRLRAAARDFRLTLAFVAVPLAATLARPHAALGYYSNVTHLATHLGAVGWLRWTSTSGLFLLVSAGAVLAPGALVGMVAAARSQDARERAFGCLTLATILVFLTEAATYEHSTGRFQERYLLVLTPLVLPAFLLWVRRGFPSRLVAFALAGALVVAVPWAPLSGYAVADGKQDSPLLVAYSQFEHSLAPAHASLVVALAVSLLLLVGAGVALLPGRRAAAVALVLATTWLAAEAAGAAVFDMRGWTQIRAAEPADLSWVQDAGVRNATFVSTYGVSRFDALLALYFNPKGIAHEAVLGRGEPTDAFAAPGLHAGADGILRVGSEPLRDPLVLDRSGSAVVLRGAERLAAPKSFALYGTDGVFRIALLAEGFRADGSLASNSRVVVWPAGSGATRGTLVLRFTAPAGRPETIELRRAHHAAQTVEIPRGTSRTVRVPVDEHGPATVWVEVTRGAIYRDRAFVSGTAALPRFEPS